MRYSQLFGKTQKEVPREATTISHQLLLRAGYIHQIAAGIYDFLPLGYRVLTKLDLIIKEELSKEGVQHLLMPFVHPAALWQETGRYDKMDKVLAKFQSKRGADLILAPTHEETVTDLARNYIHTYKDMPVTLNQNQWKYRDEIRVNGGLLRTREFLMQDAYSFDVDKAGLDESFNKVSRAYHAIFKRVGIEVSVVKADSGTMGGSDSQEFMMVSEVGEDTIFVCDQCDYSANVEKAESKFETYPQDKEMKAMEEVKGEGLIGVEALAEFLKIPVHATTKTIIFQADDKVVAVMIRGDYDINEVKLKNYLGCQELNLASAEVVEKLTGAVVGYAGPIGLPKEVTVVADLTCEGRTNFEAGANKTNYHNINVNFERDFPTPVFVDIRSVKDGDVCCKCEKGKLSSNQAIELGHVFKLGNCYSEQMGAKFVDKDGKQKLIEMGCYGIGITRLIGAIVENMHDEHGIIWPKNAAPFQLHLISLGKEEEVQQKAQELYQELTATGWEVLYDDREESAGKKFADADLIGLPVRVVISNRTLAENAVEWKERAKADAEKVALKDFAGRVQKFFA